MDIILQSPGFRVSNRIEGIVFDKFERFENRSWRVIRCEVVLRKEKSTKEDNCIVEARLVIPGNDLFAKDAGGRFVTAAESVCLDLERQLRKRKTRLQPKTRVKASAKRITVNEEELE